MADLIQVVFNGLLMGGIYGVLSLGLNMIYGVMGIVNFAHGEMLMLGSYVTFWLFSLFGLNPFLALPAAFFLVGVVGIGMQFFLFKPLMRLPQFDRKTLLVTFGLSLAITSLVRIVWTAQYRGVSPPFSSMYIGAISISFTRLAAFFLAISTATILYVFLQKTYLGKAIRAVSEDLIGAMSVGISTNRVYVTTLLIGTGLAGIGGSLLAPLYAIYPWMGTDFNLICFSIVVFGGAGSFLGSLGGGFVLGLAEAFVASYLGIQWTALAIFVIILLTLLLRPKGILGR